MTLRSTLFLLIFALFVLPKAYALESPEPSKGEEYKIEKGFEEKIDAIISKRLHLSSVRSKLENTNSKFVAVYGHVLEANDKRALESADEEDLFVAESLFYLLNEQLMQRNDLLLKKATPDVRNTYKHLMNRFNFISLERLKILVDYYYDKAKDKWIRPAKDQYVLTITMVVKSGYFLYQEKDSAIEIRRYGYYIPNPNVKRIFFNDGYSEVLWKNPNGASLSTVKVLPYQLIEKIQSHKEPNQNRKKIANLLKIRNFSTIPLVIDEIDKSCEKDSCPEEINYKRYLNTLGTLYRAGVLRRF
jgi:hypothetical protein